MVRRHFGDVPRRDAPPRPDFDEPAPTSERRVEHHDALAPAPAVALGWRVPDPDDLDAYLPHVLLASVLSAGDASRLRRRLVQDDRSATDIGAHVALMEEAFDVRNPTAMVIEAHHGADVPADRVVRAVDEELDRVANDGVPEDELARIRARTASAMLQRADHVLARTLAMASYEQQRGRAELVGEMPALLAAVTAEQVPATAAHCREDRDPVAELDKGEEALREVQKLLARYRQSGAESRRY